MGAERVERRLAAILAADVVGYSRLIGFDEETGGAFHVREDEPAADRGGDASKAVRVTGIWPPQA